MEKEGIWISFVSRDRSVEIEVNRRWQKARGSPPPLERRLSIRLAGRRARSSVRCCCGTTRVQRTHARTHGWRVSAKADR